MTLPAHPENRVSDEARSPSTGWIKPSIDDKIIIAARLGATADQIAVDLSAMPARVKRVLTRAYIYGFLTEAEARKLGVFASRGAAA